MKPFRRQLTAAAGGLLLAGGAMAALLPQGAHAATSVKHTGPILTLSNGRTVQILTNISDSQSNVKEIDYTIHGPAGSRELKVAFQRAWGGLINRAVYVADQASGTYTTDTLVKTATAGSAHAVSAQSTVQNGTAKSTVTASGTENAHIGARLSG